MYKADYSVYHNWILLLPTNALSLTFTHYFALERRRNTTQVGHKKEGVPSAAVPNMSQPPMIFALVRDRTIHST